MDRAGDRAARRVTLLAQHVAAAPPPQGISRLLVANRGEIAIRVVRAARALGIAAVTCYTPADAAAAHARAGGGGAAALAHDGGYRDAGALVAAARAHNCDALHPGYGFLSEARQTFRRATFSHI